MGSTQSTWGVPIESAKQLEFKMKFMGLVVVALVVLLSILSPAMSAPAPVPAPKPITPALATALGAAAGDLAVAGASIPAVPVLLASSFVPAGALSSILTSGVIPAKIVLAKGPPWQGLELLGWRQPEVEKARQRHQPPEYRDQTLDHPTLVDRIYNVNNAIFALYIHVIICLGQKKLVDFVIDTLYIHVLYTLTSRRLPKTF